MTKEERLAYMKRNFKKYRESDTPAAVAVIPITKPEIIESSRSLDGFREHVREKNTTLTTDEE
jgi:hypothetical protein